MVFSRAALVYLAGKQLNFYLLTFPRLPEAVILHDADFS